MRWWAVPCHCLAVASCPRRQRNQLQHVETDRTKRAYMDGHLERAGAAPGYIDICSVGIDPAMC